MTAWESVAAYRDDKDAVRRDLARALFSGELAFLLGAGVSKPFGLPSWPDLVKRCLELVGIDHSDISEGSDFDDLKKAAGKFREAASDKYVEFLARALYSDFNRAKTTDLLNSVGAMLMGSRRGRIREVWTLNYDDVLEWHLNCHGFVSQTITKVPNLLRDVDVTVFHAHGYVPSDASAPDSEIIFDDRSYANRTLGPYEPWRHAIQWAIRSRVFLTLGLSMTDRLIMDLFLHASGLIEGRPSAFWFLGPDVVVDYEDCHRHNIVPVKFDSYDEYAPFLLGVCEEAMNCVQTV